MVGQLEVSGASRQVRRAAAGSAPPLRRESERNDWPAPSRPSPGWRRAYPLPVLPGAASMACGRRVGGRRRGGPGPARPSAGHHGGCPEGRRAGIRPPRLGRAHDEALLVDPHHVGDVDHSEEGVHAMFGIEERRVLRASRLDKRSGRLRAAQLQRDGDDLGAPGVQLCTQRLPPGQVEATASIRSPGDEDDLLASQRRQTETRCRPGRATPAPEPQPKPGSGRPGTPGRRPTNRPSPRMRPPYRGVQRWPAGRSRLADRGARRRRPCTPLRA